MSPRGEKSVFGKMITVKELEDDMFEEILSLAETVKKTRSQRGKNGLTRITALYNLHFVYDVPFKDIARLCGIHSETVRQAVQKVCVRRLEDTK